MYYVSTDMANSHAAYWYKNSYAHFLYPRANLASQRISDFLKSIGTDNNRQAFLRKHIEYVLNSTDSEYCVLIDSTGCPNAIHIPITKVSRHENDVNIEFRVIAVVQRSTGLPVYYEVIPGNVVDISTVEHVIHKLGLYGCKVVYLLGDAGYYCPGTMERLVLKDIDFMARVNPTYDIYAKVMEEHFEELQDSRSDHLYDYRDRTVKIIKVPSVIAVDKNSGEKKQGFVYLCRDIQGYHSKCDHFMSSKQYATMTQEERAAAMDKFGVFAIITSKEVPEAEVLPEYYSRQGIEQFFDYAKNYGKMVPVRAQRMETVEGHMLMSFIATFLNCLIRNRLDIADASYTAVPDKLAEKAREDEEVVEVETATGKEYVLVQDPIAGLFSRSPASLFFVLQLQNAEVFEKEIVPSLPTRETNDFYHAFGLHYPTHILRENGIVLPILKEGAKDRCTRSKIFSVSAKVTEEQILEKRKAAEAKALAELAAKQGIELPGKKEAETQTVKRGPGRPPGSKNRKTLEREAEAARLAEQGNVPQKRGRGRPPGSKNKKTLAREAAEREKKRGPGRPPGSKNKKKYGKKSGQKKTGSNIDRK